MDKWRNTIDYWLNTTYACGLIAVNENLKIIFTCPIYKWMIGNDFNYVLSYLRRTNKFAEIIKME